MVPRTLWIGWIMTLLTVVVSKPKTAPICDLGPCKCISGKLICDCSRSIYQEILLEDELLDNYIFSAISIANCSHVHVGSQALAGLPALQRISISNIAKLTLEEQSFSWTTESHQHSGLLVNITDCAIPEIPSYCFRGFLRDIILTSVNISRVYSYAFSSIDHAEKIDFNKVHVHLFDPQSFKRFSADFFTFIDSYISVFPKTVMWDVHVHQEMRLHNVKAEKIETQAFTIHGPSHFKMVQSSVGIVENRAFQVTTKGDASFHENSFSRLETGALVGIAADTMYVREAGKQDLVFENNTVSTVESASLLFNISGFYPRLDWITISQQCSCGDADWWSTDLVFYSIDKHHPVASTQASAFVFCLNPKPTRVKDFQRLYCDVVEYSLLAKSLVVAGVVVVLSIIGVVIYCGIRNKGKRYINEPSRFVQKAALPGKSQVLVVPDGKTYRETELHVFLEYPEPIVSTEYVQDRPDRSDNS